MRNVFTMSFLFSFSLLLFLSFFCTLLPSYFFFLLLFILLFWFSISPTISLSLAFNTHSLLLLFLSLSLALSLALYFSGVHSGYIRIRRPNASSGSKCIHTEPPVALPSRTHTTPAPTHRTPRTHTHTHKKKTGTDAQRTKSYGAKRETEGPRCTVFSFFSVWFCFCIIITCFV